MLFQVHFLSLLLEERGAGDLAAVADNTRAKLIRRHPHVFGEVEVEGSGEVLDNWDRIKREQEGRGELFDDVPENLPALLHARKLQRRVASRAPEREPEAGDSLRGLEQGAQRLAELVEAGAEAGPEAPDEQRRELEEVVGELLFAAVDVARRLSCDPELALRRASGRFRESAGGEG